MKRGTNVPAGCRVHNGLASLLSKSALKVLAIVGSQVVAGNGLTAILVYSLRDLVAGGVTQTGEEGEELLADGGGGLVLEDDGVELRHTRDSAGVAHQTLGDCVDGVEDGQLGDTGGTCFIAFRVSALDAFSFFKSGVSYRNRGVAPSWTPSPCQQPLGETCWADYVVIKI